MEDANIHPLWFLLFNNFYSILIGISAIVWAISKALGKEWWKRNTLEQQLKNEKLMDEKIELYSLRHEKEVKEKEKHYELIVVSMQQETNDLKESVKDLVQVVNTFTLTVAKLDQNVKGIDEDLKNIGSDLKKNTEKTDDALIKIAKIDESVKSSHTRIDEIKKDLESHKNKPNH